MSSCLPDLFISRFLLYSVGFADETHPLGFGGQSVAYVGFTGLLDHMGTHTQIGDLHTDRVAGTDLVTELDFIDSSEKEQAAFLEFLLVAQRRSSRLRHRFYENNTRHYGILRKMSLEEEILVGKFSGAHAAVVVTGNDFINKQKRFAVRQQGFYIIRYHLMLPYALNFLRTTTPLCPPNPNVALIAQSTLHSIPLLGV